MEGNLLIYHSYTTTTNDGAPAQSFHFSRIELDVPIDDRRFEMPAPTKPVAPVEPAPRSGVS
jgi:hypothetical protein